MGNLILQMANNYFKR